MFCLPILFVLFANLVIQEVDMQWERLADIPDAIGLAGPFAGTIGTKLVVAGGANFPDRPPWQGGTKVWHDRIWELDNPGAAWREIGRLPKPLAYGVSIWTVEHGLICIGGSDANRHCADVFQIQSIDGKITAKTLPPLPRPIANACGAKLGSKIYIAGGTASPNSTDSLHVFLSLDLSSIEKGWVDLEPWPGRGRMLAVSATIADTFFLVSGVDLTADRDGKPMRHYLTDAYRFQERSGWSRIPDVPTACVAAPSPAPIWDANGFSVIGGDDGTQVGFQPIDKHPGFSKSVQVFDTSQNKWMQLGYTPAPRVTVPIVHWNHCWLMISGEERPGVRSPQVWSFKTPHSK